MQNTPQKIAEEIVSKMTLEEKASQLKYDAPSIERLGIPFYNWWSEGLHGVARAGVATMFPQAIGLAAMFDENLMYDVADVTATEARAKYNTYSKHGDRDIYKGLTLWSPNINIFRDPRWGRGHETYGECPFLTKKLGVAFVKGMQGPKEYLKAAACAKHFAVHSGPEAVRHEFDAVSTPKDMEETYLPAFEALVKEAKVEGVMGAYNRVNGEPACASPFLMGKLKEWGFDGYFVSDCWAIRDFHEHHMVTKTATESAALALKTGCDCNCGNTYIHMLQAYEEGLVNEEDITTAAVHLMRTRARLGILNQTSEFDEISYDVIACKEHKELSLKCSEKSMVLLKNNNNVLPLKKDLKSIAVIGPNANSRDALIGNYFGTADRYTTFLEGIQDCFDGKVNFSEGCHLYKDRVSGLALPGDRYAEAITAAENSEVVVLCLGLDAMLEGEEGDTGNEFCSGDKPDLQLPESQRILIEKVLKVGKPTIIVLAAGSSLNPQAETADAIIQAWYPGSEGGKALANILFGKVSPSAKLPVTFYEKAELLPDFQDYSMKNRTYRYAENNVLYPFGYGLTYSKVKVTKLEYSDNIAYVSVENIGDADTDEVVQLYIKDNVSKYAVRNYNLCGFKRVELKKGESKNIQFNLEKSAFEIVDENGVRRVDSNDFTLFAGISQPDELSTKLTGVPCLSFNIKL